MPWRPCALLIARLVAGSALTAPCMRKQEVAVKMLRHPTDAAARQRFLREVALLRRLSRDRNVVQFYGACLAPAPAGARLRMSTKVTTSLQGAAMHCTGASGVLNDERSATHASGPDRAARGEEQLWLITEYMEVFFPLPLSASAAICALNGLGHAGPFGHARLFMECKVHQTSGNCTRKN